MADYSPGVQDPHPSLAAAGEQVHVRRGPRRSRELPAAGDQEIPNRSRSDAPRVSPHTVHVVCILSPFSFRVRSEFLTLYIVYAYQLAYTLPLRETKTAGISKSIGY